MPHRKAPTDCPSAGGHRRQARTRRAPDFESDAASSATLGNVGIGVLAGGGVLIAGAVVYLLLPGNKPAPASSSSKVVPVVGSGGGGLVWTGSF